MDKSVTDCSGAIPVTETVALTTEEEAAFKAKQNNFSTRLLADLRKERNKKLAETDWWCCSDITPTQAQLDYRQALRDITKNYSSPLNVVWPTKP
tara:strand:- start:2519 stop:2803 length:285 start_codon:yes stop_codon:yes gene_type:complete